MTKKILIGWVMGGLLTTGLTSRGSMVIDGFAPSVNDRFANDSSFILHGTDLSGVGINADGRWGTLVSPNVVASANHYPPAPGSQFTFYASNDPGGESVTRTVGSTARIGSSDIRLAVLDAPVPVGYATYPVATLDITSPGEFTGSPYHDTVAHLFGRSPTGVGYGAFAPTDQAVGQNRLDLWYDSVTGGGTTDVALGAVQDLPGESNYLPSEAYLQSGDSGGPLMVLTNGILHLVGINWFIDTVDIDPGEGEVLRNTTGFSYVGNYDQQIQAFINVHAVPEPSTLVLLLTLLLIGLGTLRPEIYRRSSSVETAPPR